MSSNEAFINEVNKISSKKISLCNWEAEKMAELSRSESRRVDYEEGIEKGIEQGKNENTIEMIKSMLKENADINFISKVSGKSIQEIEEINIS